MAGSVVLQSAADIGLKRVIYVSTCQVYGSWGDPFVPPKYFPIDESHPYQPQNVYALSKIGNENYANFAGKHYNLSVAIFRFPWVISWPISDDELCDWLDRPMREIDGFCTYVHAKDAARACALALGCVCTAAWAQPALTWEVTPGAGSATAAATGLPANVCP